ncbi:DUF1090 family protein [Stutzerimonas sp. VN223-3]|uniref:DUF1090 family protein n=1 Tax=Stutzerimonas TaxID=2901164 RepID=UPI0021090D48|nr:DUF1090 family protein [Stutzerimonas stutzeri]MCQ4311394.1 DUF1090 domain-containing protein [Stutzerimonas stutzeri]
MSARRTILTLLLLSFSGAQASIAAPNPVEACRDARKTIGEQIQDARLKGDDSQRVALEERLQSLNERCRGMVPLQSNHVAVEKATRLTSEREAQLREALGTGDAQMIELHKRRLDQARKQLEAAKR